MPHNDDNPGDVHTYWVIYDDGSVGRLETTSEDPPVLSKPGQLVTEAEYLARMEEIRAARAARLEAEEAARREAARQDYEALIALGFPEATARRMSGYTPDPEES